MDETRWCFLVALTCKTGLTSPGGAPRHFDVTGSSWSDRCRPIVATGVESHATSKRNYREQGKGGTESRRGRTGPKTKSQSVGL